MSTINTVNNTPAAYVAPEAVNAQATSAAPASGFSQTLAVAQSPKTWLTAAEASDASRPNVKQFMDRSGAEFLDASELIYGVVGSNTDVRDWAAIMASDDPISAARQATAQMYGRTDISPRTGVTYLSSSDTVAQEGNFAIRQLKDEHDKVVDQGLKLIDAQGLLLRDAGSSPEVIRRNAWLFGFDTQPLAKLVQAATTVSDSLGQAVQQASTQGPAAHATVASNAMPVPVMAADNAKLLGLAPVAAADNAQAAATIAGSAAATVAATVPATVAAPTTLQAQSVATTPIATTRTTSGQDEGTSPSLQQAIADATANAFSYADSATYLSSLFRA